MVGHEKTPPDSVGVGGHGHNEGSRNVNRTRADSPKKKSSTKAGGTKRRPCQARIKKTPSTRAGLELGALVAKPKVNMPECRLRLNKKVLRHPVCGLPRLSGQG
jgi:hypothetical protein